MIFKSFEEFLRDEHSSTYIGTDDDMPEDFEKWLQNLDVEELIKQADNFSSHRLVEMKKDVTKFLLDYEI